ncbi:MAG: LpxL/LpxP family Kdo(2)-lipid IV(A) lauroyl/palmitoleoyl acyltransferase [Methylophaga sp.]|nr:LpxL/LpxP family Kdo(2)-lipid IV(A) lauroyl/palmitoleoyl acyltransferase [Methylophaga sp.]
MKLLQAQFFHPRFWPSWFGLLLMRLSIYCPIQMQLWMAKVMAVLIRPAIKARRRIAKRNLELCFPELSDEQRHALLEKNNQTMGMMMIETALSWWASDRRLQKRVSYHGLEHIEAALEKGNGVILLTAHFTSMEIGGRLIMLKFPCYVMFRELKNALFNAFMMRARTHHSEGIVMQKEPRAMVRALRKNKIVWYAPDQDLGKRQCVFAKFFGVQASTVIATGRLAKMSGAAVIPFTPRRDEKGHYTLTIGAPLTDFPTGDDVADAQRINDIIEHEIRHSPEQYLWAHRRFKTQPEGKGLLYKK